MHTFTIAIAQEKVLVPQSYYFAYLTSSDRLKLIKVTRGENFTKEKIVTGIRLPPFSIFTWIGSDLFCVKAFSNKFFKVSINFNSGNLSVSVTSKADTLVENDGNVGISTFEARFIFKCGGVYNCLHSERYDVISNQWEMLPEMNNPRVDPSSCTLNNSLYVIGDHASIERLANVNAPVNCLSPWTIILLPEEF